MRRLSEDDRARDELLRTRVRAERRIRWPLREGDVARSVDEARELSIRDGMLVDRKAVHGYAMTRALLRIEALVAHAELAALDPHHLVRDAHP